MAVQKVNDNMDQSWDGTTPFTEPSVIERIRWKLTYISIQSIMLGRAERFMSSQDYISAISAISAGPKK